MVAARPRSFQTIRPSRRSCVTFRNKLFFYDEEDIISPPYNLQAWGPLPVGCPRQLIQHIRIYPLYLHADSSTHLLLRKISIHFVNTTLLPCLAIPSHLCCKRFLHQDRFLHSSRCSSLNYLSYLFFNRSTCSWKWRLGKRKARFSGSEGGQMGQRWVQSHNFTSFYMDAKAGVSP
jgi:hypothetical protein